MPSSDNAAAELRGVAQRTAITRRAHVLFYDGACGLCRRSIAAIQRRRPRRPLVMIDIHDDRLMSRYPWIDRRTAIETVILLTPSGRQRYAYHAVTGVLRLLPRWRRVYWLLRLWPMQVLGGAAYRIIGRNRYRISRWLGWEEPPPPLCRRTNAG